MENKCKYSLAWIGYCNKHADNSCICEEHKKEVCSSCGKQATHQCEETMGLVCGAPLCDECEHTLCDNGCNGGGNYPPHLKGHCKKTEQVYKSWCFKDKEDGSLTFKLRIDGDTRQITPRKLAIIKKHVGMLLIETEFKEAIISNFIINNKLVSETIKLEDL